MDATVALGLAGRRGVGEALEALGQGLRAGRADRVGRRRAARARSRSTAPVLDRWLEAAADSLDSRPSRSTAPYARSRGWCASAGPALLRLPGAGSRLVPRAPRRRPRTAPSVLGPDRRRHSRARRRGRRRAAPGSRRGPRSRRRAAARRGRRRRARRARGRARRSSASGSAPSTPTSGLAAAPVVPAAALAPHALGRSFRARSPTFLRRLTCCTWPRGSRPGGSLGRAALEGRLDPAGSSRGLLLLHASCRCRLLGTWSQGVFAIGAGALLKQRLLAGALAARAGGDRATRGSASSSAA